MSEIDCAQLHSELFRRRHSTRQSHGLFALAKHLLISMVILHMHHMQYGGSVKIAIHMLALVEEVCAVLRAF